MSSPAPDTVTDAIDFLRSEGYSEDFELTAEGVVCATFPNPHALENASVDHTFRFEGETDPGDEAIVLGLTTPGWGAKGILVSAYGTDADPETAELLRNLTR